jgi:hypothetical protein
MNGRKMYAIAQQNSEKNSEGSLNDKQFFNHQDTKARKNKRPYHKAFLGVFVSS